MKMPSEYIAVDEEISVFVCAGCTVATTNHQRKPVAEQKTVVSAKSYRR
jgi:hypothetical protein